MLIKRKGLPKIELTEAELLTAYNNVIYEDIKERVTTFLEDNGLMYRYNEDVIEDRIQKIINAVEDYSDTIIKKLLRRRVQK